MIHVQIIGAPAVIIAGLERAIGTRRGMRLIGAPARRSAAGTREGIPGPVREADCHPVRNINRKANVVVLYHDSAVADLSISNRAGRQPSPGSVAPAPSDPQLVLMTHDPGLAREALAAGVSAVLPADADEKQVVAAVEGAAAGLLVLDPEAVRSLLARGLVLPSGAGDEIDVALTPRESEILGMMAEGWANKTIAHRLGISEHTVKYHVESVLEKLQAESRTEAVAIGLRTGRILL
jgi:DNA-binding CsgD family transcriptional regulator